MTEQSMAGALLKVQAHCGLASVYLPVIRPHWLLPPSPHDALFVVRALIYENTLADMLAVYLLYHWSG